MGELDDAEKLPDLGKGGVITLEIYPGLPTRSISVNGVQYNFPEPADVVDVSYELADRILARGERERADKCLEAFQAVVIKLTGASARLELAAECESKGELPKMNEHIKIGKLRLQETAALVQATKAFAMPAADRIEKKD